MQACAHCGERLADAAARCPRCGMVVGAALTGVVSQHDESIGFVRSPLVLALIIGAVLLLAAAGISWFLG